MITLSISLHPDLTSASFPIKTDFPKKTLSWIVENISNSQSADISQFSPMENPSPKRTSSPILVFLPILIPILDDCLFSIFVHIVCHGICGRYNLLILTDYLHFWKGNIGRVYMGNPTKKDTIMTTRPFFIQPRGCSKAIKEFKFWVCSYWKRRQIILIISSSSSYKLPRSAKSNREITGSG